VKSLRQRKFPMAALIAVFFLVGCTGLFDVQIEIEDPVAAKIKACSVLGRRIANYTMKANPELIPDAEIICEKAMTIIGDPEKPVGEETIKAAILEFVDLVGQWAGDPLLREDIADLMELVTFEIPEGDQAEKLAEYQGYAYAFVEGFQNGIELSKVGGK